DALRRQGREGAGLRTSGRGRDGTHRKLFRRSRAAAHDARGHRLRLLRVAHDLWPDRREVLDQQGRNHARGLHRRRLDRHDRARGAEQRSRWARRARRPRRQGTRTWRRRARWRWRTRTWRTGRTGWRRSWTGRLRRWRRPWGRRRWTRSWRRWTRRSPPERRWALMLSPKRVKHRKQHRGRHRGTSRGQVKVQFGEYGLKALEGGWLTNRQCEAALVAMRRKIKRGGKVW